MSLNDTVDDTASAVPVTTMVNRNIPPTPDAAPSQPTPTLLPEPVAQAVSFATRSTSLAIRLGSVAGSYGLDAARFTTLSSLELARTMVESVLSRAGRETLSRSQSDLATVEAESVIERSLENLHHAMTQVVFWTTAGFRFTNTTIFMASEASQLFLSSLDQLLGSTDSSRAIASIITLIRREFRDPVTGAQGKTVGVSDLTLGICAFAYLQQWCWKTLEEETCRQECEEIVWDVVVLNDGERVDIQEENLRDTTSLQPKTLQQQIGTPEGESSKPPQERHRNLPEDEEIIIHRLKDQIVESLPPESTISISNSISTTQTITIDIDGPRPLSLPTLPGAEVVETRVTRSPQGTRSGRRSNPGESSYRVVYKLQRSKVGTTTFQNHDERPKTPVVEKPNPEKATRKVQSQEPSKLPKRTMATSPKSPPGNRAVGQRDNSGQPPRVPSRVASRSMGNSGQEATSRKPKILYTSPQTTASIAQQTPEREANQKRLRVPLSSRTKTDPPRESSTVTRKVLPKRKTDPPVNGKNTEKRGTLKQAIREGSQSLSNMWHKDSTTTDSKPQTRRKEPESRTESVSSSAELPISKQELRSSTPSLDDESEDPELIQRSASRASYVSIHEYRRDSLVAQTDTYSIQSTLGLRPNSPSLFRTEPAADSSWTTSRHDGNSVSPGRPLSGLGHRRATSHVPSLYSLASNDSQSSLVLASYKQKSAYTAADALNVLRRDGVIDGIFPRAHVLRNITRYMRFSSASYGSSFLKAMGISKEMPILQVRDGIHSDVRHFLHHTESDMHSVLLASFVDPEGGTNSSGLTGTGVPLVHYISLDHEARTVVLACRGTLGFEDVLADLLCDYDVLTWRGRAYKVHKGVHASARRLLYGGDGRVLVTIREALLEFPDYGLVLCGHSLGGAVTALLGVMLSEPNPNGTGFVTADEPHGRSYDPPNQQDLQADHPCLPPGRPIHVYAYGPPGTMSTSLRKRTRGLITSIVHGNDVVPSLSLGSLHDSQAVAVAFKNDENQAKMVIRQRIWQALQNGMTNKWYGRSFVTPNEEKSEWGLPLLQVLRAGMTNQKLMPPGEVFVVESQRVLRRDAFLFVEEDHLGRPAQRIVLKYIKDVEARFKEMRFGRSMLMDHSPARYEDALDKLHLGVV
ncbi:hypothetical protein AK830_g7273 [Neonectria ditissima]|uniref:sn-1-specific diacylglycerol lipase n=1 Tax=Neonectria ditissima TaxID=78410 RepID=A0A0P7BFB2_9HYPO|nr:hypothetical protein AK830_g7273 [Neonectria ditissima]